MTPNSDLIFGQEEKPPENVDSDRKKPVFSPETGEWLTISEVIIQTENRSQDEFMEFLGELSELVPLRGQGLPRSQYKRQYEAFLKRLGQRLPLNEVLTADSATSARTVFDPESSDWLTIDDVQRQSSRYVADADEDEEIGFIAKDIGKKVFSSDRKTFLGRVIYVEDGWAYVKTPTDSRGVDYKILDPKCVVDKGKREFLSSQYFDDYEICRVSPELISQITGDTIRLKSPELVENET